MRVVILAVKQHPSLDHIEGERSGEQSSAFDSSMTPRELFNCADATMLFVHKMAGAGGIAEPFGYEKCRAYSVVSRQSSGAVSDQLRP